jgi:Fic family protein
MPSDSHLEPSLEKAYDLISHSRSLAGINLPTELRTLLRSMNSYYSNRIEGQHTLPCEIEKALVQDFSNNTELAAKQHLAIAHIKAEETLEQRYLGENSVKALYSISGIQDIHRELFKNSVLDSVNNNGEVLIPGELRKRDVQLGHHIAPRHQSVVDFLERWGSFYSSARRGERAVIAMAASHQRLGWIHPFIDGNGRVMRLHSHLMLHAHGHTNGLWSPLRGFARNTDQYYSFLANADQARQGSLDGRGKLSEKGLIAWIEYVIDACIDQVQFMTSMLNFEKMKSRLEACLIYESTVLKSSVRMQSLQGLHYLFLSGEEIARGDFKTMTGLGDRVATDLIGALVRRGFLKSNRQNGKVRFGIPQHSLRFLFPHLWPEAEINIA